jgi:LPXTG-site transpeptidase (sortase) family protein
VVDSENIDPIINANMTREGKKFLISMMSLMVLMFGVSVLFNSLPIEKVGAVADDGSVYDLTHKIDICHQPQGQGKEYVSVDPDINSIVKENGHDSHEGDIIPPFSWYEEECPDDISFYTSFEKKDCRWKDRIEESWRYADKVRNVYVYPGKNWDTEEQAIWSNDCVVPELTPPTHTPTPTDEAPINTPVPSEPTPTNTPVPEEETPTPTYTPSPTPTTGSETGGDSGGGESSGPPVCTDDKPGTPTNLRGSWLGSTQVKLDWEHAADPHTSYLVAYGPSENDFPWGNPNVGNDNTYTVGSLTPGAQYCFYVQAQNGCMPGDRSNVFCTNQGSTVPIVLGASDNYNPLVDGMRESYGGVVLGETTDLMDTAEVEYVSEKLPSGNVLEEGHKIAIPKIGLEENVYLPQKIGDELTVGHREVLSTTMDGSQVYYGHNAGDVFGKLYTVRAGDKIEVEKNGESLNYQVSRTDFVAETEVEAVRAEEGEIVLMTCSYTQPDHRILVIAKLID